MCLGQIVQCVALAGDATARVRDGAAERTVSLITLDAPVAPGDWLVVHSGFALERLTAEAAADALHLRTPKDLRTPKES